MPRHAHKESDEPGLHLPAPEKLAQIAATLLGPTANPSDAALDAALAIAARLYSRAEKFATEPHVCETDLAADCIRAFRDAGVLDWPADTPKPSRFPAKLLDFFGLVVKAKTPADCMKRFRDFLIGYYQYCRRVDFADVWQRQAQCPEAEATERAVRLIASVREGDKNGGYFSEERWLQFGLRYRDWWQRRVSDIRRESAEKRKT